MRGLQTRCQPQPNDVALSYGQDRRPLEFAWLARGTTQPLHPGWRLRPTTMCHRGHRPRDHHHLYEPAPLLADGPGLGDLPPCKSRTGSPGVGAPGPMRRHCFTSVRTLVVPRCNSGRGATVATRNRDGVNTVLTTTSPQGRSCPPSRSQTSRSRPSTSAISRRHPAPMLPSSSGTSTRPVTVESRPGQRLSHSAEELNNSVGSHTGPTRLPICRTRLGQSGRRSTATGAATYVRCRTLGITHYQTRQRLAVALRAGPGPQPSRDVASGVVAAGRARCDGEVKQPGQRFGTEALGEC